MYTKSLIGASNETVFRDIDDQGDEHNMKIGCDKLEQNHLKRLLKGSKYRFAQNITMGCFN
jgi:hypothetical protein